MSNALKILEHSAKDSCSTSKVGAAISVNIPIKRDDFKGRAAVVTLGCAKNQVDSEIMLGNLASNGYEIVTDPAEAEVIIVNTCGFLEASVKESIDTILELSELKEKGRCRQILVAGCLVERYKDELHSSLPEVDKFVGIDEINKVADIASDKIKALLDSAARPYFLYDDSMPRTLSTANFTAYVKVSEGCNRPCTFCIIPRIRGEIRSRSIESIVKEVQALGAQGVKEINLVAQDLTAFGLDNGTGKLVDLLRAIDQSQAVKWVRMLYAYPVGVDLELLKEIVALPSVVEYIDIPLQHSSENVLKAMKRPLGKFSPRNLVEFIRSNAPEIKIRTTFIVGFPGETESDIADLEDFIAAGHFSSVGVFMYSKEAGTPSYDYPDHVSEKVKEQRRERLMLAQQKVVFERNQTLIGQQFEVIVQGTHRDTDLLLSGRTRFQAPDVDGEVIINELVDENNPPQVGDIVTVEITEISGYDLVGKII